MLDQFAQANNIRLHYLDYEGAAPPLFFLPGLTANAHAFDGLIAAGLATHNRVLALDLRGRGLTDKPATGYSMAAHAADVIALADALQLEKFICCGHSFGGLLTMYLAAQFPARIHKAVILDAAAGLISPATSAMVQPAVDRLRVQFPSWENFLATMKAAPYLHGMWNEFVENYYRADVKINDDGTVNAQSNAAHITEAIKKAGDENWFDIAHKISQPALLLHASAPVAAGLPPLVSTEIARATAAALANGTYKNVAGNHWTMLYEQGAQQIVQHIHEFLAEE